MSKTIDLHPTWSKASMEDMCLKVKVPRNLNLVPKSSELDLKPLLTLLNLPSTDTEVKFSLNSTRLDDYVIFRLKSTDQQEINISPLLIESELIVDFFGVRNEHFTHYLLYFSSDELKNWLALAVNKNKIQSFWELF